MNRKHFLGLVLSATEDTIDMLEHALLPPHPREPALSGIDPATRTLLYAADALAFALARYRCEHGFTPRDTTQLPF